MSRAAQFRANARRIAPLAWPVFVGQVAVLAFATVDTVMIGRTTAIDLAALAVGGATYMTVFIGLMGIVLAIGPIAGQLFGAGAHAKAGHEAKQTVWLALALSLVGGVLLLMPEPIIALSQVEPAVEAKVRQYLQALACALPAALVFTAYRGFHFAVSRPKIVMAFQLGGLALKVPANTLIIFGAEWTTPFGTLTLPAFGAVGCGIATALVMWVQLGALALLLTRDPFYVPFGLDRPAVLGRPDAASLKGLLRLGLPMGASYLIEATGFTFMAIFIARLGATPVAGHQIAVNMVTLLFMMPLALSIATSTLVAQRIGAGDPADARAVGWDGLAIGTAIAAALGLAVYAAREPLVAVYTSNATIAAAALPLLAWVAVFHVADAAQTIAAFVLRAWRVAVVPLVVYVLALWVVGLGGGFAVAFGRAGDGELARSLRGAQGFWSMATLGLAIAATGMAIALAVVMHRRGESFTLSRLRERAG